MVTIKKKSPRASDAGDRSSRKKQDPGKHSPHHALGECSHHHFGGHIHLQDQTVKNIRIAFFLNAGFSVFEFIGALYTNSVAIAADAVHDLGDSLALALAWGLAYLANRKKTPLFTYGFQRLSLLGALINTTILLFGSLATLYYTLPRLLSPQSTNSPIMLGFAVIGVAVNGYAVYRTSSKTNLNERTVSLHLWEDVLGWIAVGITSVVMMFTEFYILDPLLSIVIVAIILKGVVKNLKATVLLFLQASPGEIETPKVEKTLSDHRMVQGVHDVHIWSLDGDKHVLSAHIVVDKKTSKPGITSLKAELKERLYQSGISHATLEIEYEDEKCSVIETC